MTHYHPADSRDVYTEEQQRRLQAYEENKPEDDVKGFFSTIKEKKANTEPKSFLVFQKPASPTATRHHETAGPKDNGVASGTGTTAAAEATSSSGLRFCTGCGVLTQPQWKFCNKCGTKLA